MLPGVGLFADSPTSADCSEMAFRSDTLGDVVPKLCDVDYASKVSGCSRFSRCIAGVLLVSIRRGQAPVECVAWRQNAKQLQVIFPGAMRPPVFRCRSIHRCRAVTVTRRIGKNSFRSSVPRSRSRSFGTSMGAKLHITQRTVCGCKVTTRATVESSHR